MKEQDIVQGFFKKNKKWFIGLIGAHFIIPFIVLGTVVSVSIYVAKQEYARSKPFKFEIVNGYDDGYQDGLKDIGHKDKTLTALNLQNTAWYKYKSETEEIKKNATREKEEYLSRFLESERISKLAEIRLNKVQLPLQLELKQRFLKPFEFYIDYVERRVKRKLFKSDEEYNKALEEEAWKVGYYYGYHFSTAGHNHYHPNTIKRY